NSWMHTPTGFEVNADGQFVPAGSWLEIIFNPSFPYRLVHTVIGAYLTTALAVGGVGAWHLLRHRRARAAADAADAAAQLPGEDPVLPPSLVGARTMFSMAMWMLVLVAPLQVLVGDLHGLNTLEHQPAKVMAMEGHYDSDPHSAPLILIGVSNCAMLLGDFVHHIPNPPA